MTNSDLDQLLEIEYELSCIDNDNVRYGYNEEGEKIKKQKLVSEKESLKTKIQRQIDNDKEYDLYQKSIVDLESQLETVSDKLGNELQVKYLEINALKEDNSELNQLNADFRNKKRQLVNERDNLKAELKKMTNFIDDLSLSDSEKDTYEELLKENN